MPVLFKCEYGYQRGDLEYELEYELKYEGVLGGFHAGVILLDAMEVKHLVESDSTRLANDNGTKDESRIEELRDLELHAQFCFVMATTSMPKAVRLGLQRYESTQPSLYVHMDLFAGDCDVVRPPIIKAGQPIVMRMVLQVDAATRSRIPDSIIDWDLEDEKDFIRRPRVRVGSYQAIPIRLHACDAGVSLSYRGFDMKLGLSKRAACTPSSIVMRVSRARRAMEGALCKLFGETRDRRGVTIKFGRGAYKGMNLFLQLQFAEVVRAVQDSRAVTGYISRAYRIYISPSVETRENMGAMLIDNSLPSDGEFQRVSRGIICGPDDIDVYMHACSYGVFLHYKYGLGVSKPKTLWVAKSTKRVNCCLSHN